MPTCTARSHLSPPTVSGAGAEIRSRAVAATIYQRPRTRAAWRSACCMNSWWRRVSVLPVDAGPAPGDARQSGLFPAASVLGIEPAAAVRLQSARRSWWNTSARSFFLRLARRANGGYQVSRIDVGTGGTRALIVDEHGRVVASGTQVHAPFASAQPGGGAGSARLVASLPFGGSARSRRLGTSAEEIACAGFSGQMHGAVLLDARDEVVRPAIIWCDQRTEPQVQELSDLFGADRLIRLTCNPPLTNFTLTKLLWVRENEPRNWERVAHVMLPRIMCAFNSRRTSHRYGRRFWNAAADVPNAVVV